MGAYEGDEIILVADASDHVLITELKNRGVEFNPAIGKLGDNALLLELARRNLGNSIPVAKAPDGSVVTAHPTNE